MDVSLTKQQEADYRYILELITTTAPIKGVQVRLQLDHIAGVWHLNIPIGDLVQYGAERTVPFMKWAADLSENLWKYHNITLLVDKV